MKKSDLQEINRIARRPGAKAFMVEQNLSDLLPKQQEMLKVNQPVVEKVAVVEKEVDKTK